MTVEQARAEYAQVASWLAWHQCPPYLIGPGWACPFIEFAGRRLDALSLAYDNAMAEASDERIRASVAWG